MKNLIGVILGDPNLQDKVKLNGKFSEEDKEVIKTLKRALNLIKEYKFRYYDNHKDLIDDLVFDSRDINLALNLCDEGYFNNPEQEAVIPVILENIVKIPYSGASFRCLVKCYKKSDIKRIAKEEGIKINNFMVIRNEDSIALPSFKYPVFIKPDEGDGSIGINENSMVEHTEDYYKQINWLRQRLMQLNHKSDILVEEYLPGKEITAAIIGNKSSLEIRLIQEDFSNINGLNFQIYNGKWNPKSEQWNKGKSIKPTIPRKAQNLIKEASAYLFNLLECRDYARFDWRLDNEGNPNLMETNPNCGWCWDGHLVKAFSLEKGFSQENYASILNKIIKAAEKRYYK